MHSCDSPQMVSVITVPSALDKKKNTNMAKDHFCKRSCANNDAQPQLHSKTFLYLV